MEYKVVVCPVNGTEVSDKAIEHAAYISRVSGARVLLIHIMEKWRGAGHIVTDSGEWEKIHKEWLDEGRATLEKETEKLRALGAAHVDTVLREGEASHEIIDVAEARKADLIIMATHRYSPIGKLFAGSVTDYVTRKAPCPVLWVF